VRWMIRVSGPCDDGIRVQALLRSKSKIQQQVSMTMGMLEEFSDAHSRTSPSSSSSSVGTSSATTVGVDAPKTASKPPLPPNKRARVSTGSNGSNSTVSSPESDDSSLSSSSSSTSNRPRSASSQRRPCPWVR
jgi:hypothetical protein